MTKRPALIVTALAAVVATTILIVVRLASALTDGLPDPPSMTWVLLAAGALCVAGLTHRRSPSVAWIAIILALTIATLDLAAFGREHHEAMSAETWRWLVALVCLGALSTVAAAAVYAAQPSRRIAEWVVPVGMLAVGLLALAAVWAIATADAPPLRSGSPLGNLGLVTRTLIAELTVLLGLGLLGDLRPAARRTRARIAATGGGSGSSSRRHRANHAVRIFLDELTPGQARARRAVTAERSRIAVELHADVVPAVRRALSEVERGGSAEGLAAALREVLRELDDLAASRRSVVLEEFGLLAAIERLAERTEERSDVRVTIEIPQDRPLASATMTGPATPDPCLDGRPPREVEAAAYRVVQLALENVVRHAPGALATIELTALEGEVRFAICDDGPGIRPEDLARPTADHRGLADMRSEAVACGASLTTASRVGRSGTVVRFDWRAT